MIRYVCIVMFCVLSAWAVTHTENMQTTRIRVTTEDRVLSHRLARYADKCSARVDQVLGCSAPPARLVVICAENSAQGEPRDFEYRFAENTDMLTMTAGIMKVLLRRRSRELFGKGQEEHVVKFISAGLAYSFMMSMRTEGGVFGEYNYQAVRYQFEDGVYPDARKLIVEPMEPGFPWLYRLYSEHSSLLLSCLRTLNRNPVLKLLESEAGGDTAQDAFEDAILSQLDEGVPFQKWYEQLAVQLSKRDLSSGSAIDAILQKMQELETISVVAAGSSIAALTAVKIDETKEAIETLRNDKALLRKRQVEYLKLRNEAPVLLRAPLEKYAHAMGYLASDDIRSFKRDIKEARLEFAQALAKHQRISGDLEQFEKEHTTPFRRYRAELEILSNFHEMQRKINFFPQNTQNTQNNFQ